MWEFHLPRVLEIRGEFRYRQLNWSLANCFAEGWISPQASLAALPGPPWAAVGSPTGVWHRDTCHSHLRADIALPRWLPELWQTSQVTSHDKKEKTFIVLNGFPVSHTFTHIYIYQTLISWSWHALRFLFFRKARASEVVCFILNFRCARRWHNSHLNLLEQAL